MKKDIHPEYREVVFQDVQSDFKFLTRSTMTSDEKIKWEDGKEYPVIKVEVSSASHPFYTGKKLFVDTAGRVERFNQKYKAKQAAAKSPVKEEAPAVEDVKQDTAPVAEDAKTTAEVKEETTTTEAKEEATTVEAKEEATTVEAKEETTTAEAKEKAATASEEKLDSEEAVEGSDSEDTKEN